MLAREHAVKSFAFTETMRIMSFAKSMAFTSHICTLITTLVRFNYRILYHGRFSHFIFFPPSGLFGILQMKKALRNYTDLPIVLMAPIEINSWIQFYDENIENICTEITLVPNGALVSSLSHPNIHVQYFLLIISIVRRLIRT